MKPIFHGNHLRDSDKCENQAIQGLSINSNNCVFPYILKFLKDSYQVIFIKFSALQES